MIPIAFYLVYLLAILFCAGAIGCRLLQGLATGSFRSRSGQESHAQLSDTLLLGVIVLTTLTSTVSLFHPVDSKVHLTLAILALASGGRYLWRYLKSLFALPLTQWRWPLWAAFAVCLGCMIFVAADSTRHNDTGLYHAQMVKWNATFGVVPGLANLHPRLGFNSAWDLFSSFLDQGHFSGRAFHIVNLLIAVIFLLACFRGWHRWLDGNRSSGTIFRCLGIAIIPAHYRLLLPSLSNDWPIALLLYYVVILTVEWVEERLVANGSARDGAIWKAGLVAAACAFAVTVKLSAVPILLLLLLFFALAPDKWRVAALVLIPAALVAIPYLARNVILTGYLIYPLSALDLFGFDWKVPLVDVQFYETILKYYAINPRTDWYRAVDMNFWEQVRTVAGHSGEKNILPLIPWFCIGLVAWIGVSAQAKIRTRSDFAYCTAICSVLLLGLVFCLLKAPDPRFVMGWFFAFGLFPVAWFVSSWVGSSNSRWGLWKLGPSVLLIVCTLWIMRNAGVKRLFRDRAEIVWKLYDLPIAETREARTDSGVLIRLPVRGNHLWNTALPNTPKLNSSLQMRGDNLKDGFRVTKPAFPDWRRYFEEKEPHKTKLPQL